MVANHLLQMLTLTAMEPPVAFDADSVRAGKVQVLHAIRPMTVAEVARRAVRGQYAPGQVDDRPVPGYRQEAGVSPTSPIETCAAVELYVDNWRWAGVPFFVRAGKRLPRNLTEIRVHFKRAPQALPDEGISFSFVAKHPGNEMRTWPVQADFSYAAAFGGRGPAAYATLLLDAMRGDATLFTRRDEVEREWRIITPIEDAWAELPPPSFPDYPAGSDGPKEADALIGGDQRRWHRLDAQAP
jgi:glucose-6-phosphate 1-dehydrogenase